MGKDRTMREFLKREEDVIKASARKKKLQKVGSKLTDVEAMQKLKEPLPAGTGESEKKKPPTAEEAAKRILANMKWSEGEKGEETEPAKAAEEPAPTAKKLADLNGEEQEVLRKNFIYITLEDFYKKNGPQNCAAYLKELPDSLARQLFLQDKGLTLPEEKKGEIKVGQVIELEIQEGMPRAGKVGGFKFAKYGDEEVRFFIPPGRFPQTGKKYLFEITKILLKDRRGGRDTYYHEAKLILPPPFKGGAKFKARLTQCEKANSPYLCGVAEENDQRFKILKKEVTEFDPIKEYELEVIFSDRPTLVAKLAAAEAPSPAEPTAPGEGEPAGAKPREAEAEGKENKEKKEKITVNIGDIYKVEVKEEEKGDRKHRFANGPDDLKIDLVLDGEIWSPKKGEEYFIKIIQPNSYFRGKTKVYRHQGAILRPDMVKFEFLKQEAINKYKEKHPEKDIKDIDPEEVIKDIKEDNLERFKQQWNHFTVRGTMKDGQIGPPTNLDCKASLLFFKKVFGFPAELTDNPQYVNPGEMRDGSYNIDTSGEGAPPELRNGWNITQDGKGTVVVDHHGPHATRDLSAFSILYKAYQAEGVVDLLVREPEEKIALERLSQFIDSIDNYLPPSPDFNWEKAWNNSHRKIFGLALCQQNYIDIEKLLEFFKKNDLKKVHEQLTDDELTKYGFGAVVEKKIREKDGTERIEKQHLWDRQISLKAAGDRLLNKVEKEKTFVISPEYGKIAIILDGRLDSGLFAALAHNFESILTWHPEKNTFYFNIGPYQHSIPFQLKEDLKQGAWVRGSMLFQPGWKNEPLKFTLGQFLEKIGADTSKLSGKLKNYLDEEKGGEKKEESAEFKVDDLVQWTLNGVDQFPNGKKITAVLGVKDGRRYYQVEGETTGFPEDELAQYLTDAELEDITPKIEARETEVKAPAAPEAEPAGKEAIKETRANDQREKDISYLTSKFLSSHNPKKGKEFKKEELEATLKESIEKEEDKKKEADTKIAESYRKLLADSENTYKEIFERILLFKKAQQAIWDGHIEKDTIDKRDNDPKLRKYNEWEKGVKVIVLGVIKREGKAGLILTKGPREGRNIKVTIDFSLFPEDKFKPGQILQVDLGEIIPVREEKEYFAAKFTGIFVEIIEQEKKQEEPEAEESKAKETTPEAKKPAAPEAAPAGKETPPPSPEKKPVETGEKEKKLKEVMEAAQKDFEKKKQEWERFQGLRGLFQFGKRKEKANIEREYEDIKDKYLHAKAEYVVFKTNDSLIKKSKLADGFYEVLAKKYEKKWGWELREIISRGYDWYKKLGNHNLANTEWFKKKMAQNKSGKISKFLLNFGGRYVSARSVVSYGLLGAGVLAGGGWILASSLVGRRVLAAFGGGFGTYDLLRNFEKIKMERDLPKDKLAEMKKEDIIEKMRAIEVCYLMEGKEDFGPAYKSLKAELERKIEIETPAGASQEVAPTSEKRAELLAQKLAALSQDADKQLEKALAKHVSADRRHKIEAIGMAAILGSGFFGEAIKNVKEWLWPPTGEMDWVGVNRKFMEQYASRQQVALTKLEQVTEAGKADIVKAEEAMEQLAARTHQMLEAEHLERAATIGKGEGVWHAVHRQLADQLYQHPDKFGLKPEDLADAAKVKAVLDHKTGELLIQQKFIRPDGSEIRIAKPGVKVLLEPDNKIKIEGETYEWHKPKITDVGDQKTTDLALPEKPSLAEIQSAATAPKAFEYHPEELKQNYNPGDLKEIDAYQKYTLPEQGAVIKQLREELVRMSAGSNDQRIAEAAKAFEQDFLNKKQEWEQALAQHKPLSDYFNKHSETIYDPGQSTPAYRQTFYQNKFKNDIWQQAAAQPKAPIIELHPGLPGGVPAEIHVGRSGVIKFALEDGAIKPHFSGRDDLVEAFKNNPNKNDWFEKDFDFDKATPVAEQEFWHGTLPYRLANIEMMKNALHSSEVAPDSAAARLLRQAVQGHLSDIRRGTDKTFEKIFSPEIIREFFK